MPNASHRAEVQKLLVLRSWRRQGIGLALMTAIEQAARQTGRSLLVLDTRLGMRRSSCTHVWATRGSGSFLDLL
jgi:GNAT superfamily N-acetyltransferase